MNTQGVQVRQLPLTKTAGLHRTFWNLTGDGAGGGGGGRGGGGTFFFDANGEPIVGEALALAQAAVQQAPPPQGRGAGGAGAPQGRGGGRGGGAAVTPGRYSVVIGKLEGDAFTPLGDPQFFQVITLPEKNYQLYR
jgi:hypothetical protein